MNFIRKILKSNIIWLVILVMILCAGATMILADDNNTNSLNADQSLPAAPESQQSGSQSLDAKDIALTFLWMAIILLFAKVSSLIERIGQPAVLGELIIGIILGNLVLFNITVFEPIKHNPLLQFLSQLGVVILLFQIGLGSNIGEMKKVGIRATIVALVGVIVPFVLGAAVVGPLLLPGLAINTYLFIGAALTATSVGITARVFKDLGTLDTDEAKIVLGAAVIDDVLGLIVLAVVAAIATLGAVSIGMISWIIAKSVLFLIGSIVIGQFLAPKISKAFSKIQTGVGMKFTIVISFCLIFAYLANLIGLAPIVGAFAAGLILDPVHFRYFKDPKIVDDVRNEIKDIKIAPSLKERLGNIMDKHADRHIEEFIEPIGMFLMPLFFVLTGVNVSLQTLFDTKILLLALGIAAAAFVGKIVTGLFAGKGRSKSIIGWGMVPRGEVGLIIAAMGKSMGIINDAIYSMIVIVVIITTLVPPVVLAYIIRKENIIKKEDTIRKEKKKAFSKIKQE